MSRSVFLGRELRETTVYHYDRRGRLLKSVATRDAEWLDEDRAWLMALLAEQAEPRCSGCGQLMSECMDPATAKTWEVVPHTCQACLVLDVAHDNEAEQRAAGHKPRGIKYSVRRQD